MAAERVSPPYATFSAFINFINNLRDNSIPSRIDPSVFGKASGSITYSIIAALKSLRLIDQAGVPTEKFTAFVHANDEDRKALLRDILREGYPTLWGGSIDLRTATAGQFDEHLRSEFEVKGSTVDKAASFFIAAANSAEVPISHHLKNRKPTAASTSSKKSSKQRRRNEEEFEDDGSEDEAAQRRTKITEDAADPEMVLLKLLDPNNMTPEESQAVWTLLLYAKKLKAQQQ